MYKKVSTDLNFVDREKEVEKFWEENHIFEKSMEERDGNDIYMFLRRPSDSQTESRISAMY